MRQIAFNFIKDYKKEFGGSLLEGKRKAQRPLATKNPIHLILKSCVKSVFSPHNKSLESLIRNQAKKFGVKVYDMAINWSHIHMVIKIECREDYIKFIRSLTAILAQKIRQARPHLKEIFTLRPYTRILEWGKDFKNALSYQILNQMEAWGLIKRDKKKVRLIKRKKPRRC